MTILLTAFGILLGVYAVLAVWLGLIILSQKETEEKED